MERTFNLAYVTAILLWQMNLGRDGMANDQLGGTSDLMAVDDVVTPHLGFQSHSIIVMDFLPIRS